MKTEREILEIKASQEAWLLSLSGVTAVDVGFKYVDGRRTEELAIRVHVIKKIARSKLRKTQLIPSEIDGVTTDVIQGYYVPHVAVAHRISAHFKADENYYDPLKGGVSIGPCRVINGFVYAGTLGAIVVDRITRGRMILSNFHVMCVDNNWQVGDTITQPSWIDTGSCPTDIVAMLDRAVLDGPLDAAVATENSRSALPQIVDIGGITGTTQATLGMLARKRGRTTGLTYGFVDGVGASVILDYGNGIGSVVLTNQISVFADQSKSVVFSDHGDSGSLVITPPGKAFGLLFAGGGPRSFVNDISIVLNTLQVDMLTSDGIGGFDLASLADHALAFDYDSAGNQTHLVLYRPGSGSIFILEKVNDEFISKYEQIDPGTGIGGYDLKSVADRAFAFDYKSSGKLDHLVLYRPGTGAVFILEKGIDQKFASVYTQGDPGAGIGNYNLKSPADQGFAFDYDSSGKMDHLVFYRPGRGVIAILKKNTAGRRNTAGQFSTVYPVDGKVVDPGTGIGNYDLKSPADRVFAFDYKSSGKLDHLVLYRPGTGAIVILEKGADQKFTPLYTQIDPGTGIGGYDLKSPADQVFAFDYNSSGKMDHLVLYRPGTGAIFILKNNNDGTFKSRYSEIDPGRGIGDYDLKSSYDRAFAFDYDGSGNMDHMVIYRPGNGQITILKKSGDQFSSVYP
jgi:hypothetical protein